MPSPLSTHTLPMLHRLNRESMATAVFQDDTLLIITKSGATAHALNASEIKAVSLTKLPVANRLTPNPPKDTDGRREDSGRGVRELRGRWPGLHWGRWEVGGRFSVAAQVPYGPLRELQCG